MATSTYWQTIRLVFCVLIVWLLVTFFSIIIEKQDCDELLKASDKYPISEFEMQKSDILPGLTELERLAAVKDTYLDPNLGQSAEQNNENGAISEENGITQASASSSSLEAIEQVASKNIWNDIRIGIDYICCYRDPSDADNNVGRPFPMTSYIKDIWFRYMRSAVVNTKHTKPVPVMALSDNRFEEFKTHVKSFQAYHPNRRIVIYDLGLSEVNVHYLKHAGSQFVYRRFNFEQYPDHVKDLSNFAWKVLLWAEVLEHYGALIYFDTSVSWTKNTDKLVDDMRSYNRCYNSVIEERQHTIAYGVHPMMYTFFPSNITNHMYPYNMMKTAGAVVLFNTDNCKDDILRWAILCALNPDCLSPMGSRKQCPIGTNKYQPHICHRYDQALLSILLANKYGIQPSQQDNYYIGNSNILAKPDVIS